MSRNIHKKNLNQSSKNLKKYFYWSVATIFLKILIIVNIEPFRIGLSDTKFLDVSSIWLGSDGENYLKGYQALVNDGLLSQDSLLNFWPAGYPLLILFLSLLTKSFFLGALSLLQSVIFSFSVYFLAMQLLKTRLKNFVPIIFILLIFNPTLSLSSLVLGYESLTASGFIICLAIIVKDIIEKNDKNFKKYLFANSLIFSFISFLQPRLIVSGIIFNIFWIIFRKGLKSGLVLILISVTLTLALPSTLVYRNNLALGIKSISTNLGATMIIGAGDNSKGDYTHNDSGLVCNTYGSISQQDSQKVKCVLNWYVSNPSYSAQLFLNKSIYFWSPWSGPIANGTTARNPWLKISPVMDIATSADGFKLVTGSVGKGISWVWLISSVFLMFFGFFRLWAAGSIEKFIALTSILVITANWGISLVTIGDHRFRIPIMGLSLLLQAVGIRSIFVRNKADMVDGSALR